MSDVWIPPDPLVPEQWFDPGPACADTPEQRLMFAVLLDAVLCLPEARMPSTLPRRGTGFGRRERMIH